MSLAQLTLLLPRLERIGEHKCGTVRRRIQKVACVRDALTKLGDDCKAAITAVVTRKE